MGLLLHHKHQVGGYDVDAFVPFAGEGDFGPLLPARLDGHRQRLGVIHQLTLRVDSLPCDSKLLRAAVEELLEATTQVLHNGLHLLGAGSPHPRRKGDRLPEPEVCERIISTEELAKNLIRILGVLVAPRNVAVLVGDSVPQSLVAILVVYCLLRLVREHIVSFAYVLEFRGRLLRVLILVRVPLHRQLPVVSLNLSVRRASRHPEDVIIIRKLAHVGKPY
mmetsp:Transcript_49745/g.112987  ORF Transcript_49745/g.112987 Transcript_49745/m.112987 type:complete len:221 (-) Transcript_49745:37-699(-)